MTSLNFSKALSVLRYLILLIKRELNIWTPCGMFLFIITAKTPFLSSPLISLCYEFIKGVSYTRTNISTGRSYLTDLPTEVRWFSITGFLVIECF